MVRKSKLVLVALAALVAAAIVVLPAMAADPVKGAIFTTTNGGTTVNGNIYASKDAVYLNGGPQPNAPCGVGGLEPDGDYYFQVTDPSGATLLSTDPIENRRVTVSGGLITAYVDDNVDPPPHVTGDGKCPDAISVQLAPYNDTLNSGGEYKVWMTPVGSYSTDTTVGTFGFINSQSKTDNFKVRTSSNGTDLDVGIVGNKFYDADTDGVWDADEPGIGGWRIYKKPPEIPDEIDTTSVGQIGQYSFLVAPKSGDYTITEGKPQAGFFPYSAWRPTTATSGSVSVGTEDTTGPDFGNVCLGAGGGLTLGFWSNQNGQNLIVTRDSKNKPTTTLTPAALALLGGTGGTPYLRNANGTYFVPVNPNGYTQFRNWLLKADATNMAYMLSAQLAAMKLNVNNGNVSGNALIYAPGTLSANSSGYATVNALMAEATASLQANGNTVKAGATRTYQEALKIALDKANNSLNFVQPVLPGERVPCDVPQSWLPAG
jgi:hypothetical protein